MATSTENVSDYTDGTAAPPDATQNLTIIGQQNYQTMLTILNNLATHNHIFYDDYTTVCDCQCDCNCSRGTL